MTAELVAGLVALIVALVGGGVGWAQIRKHGSVKEERDEAQREVDDAAKRMERRTDPVLDDRSYRARLQRASERLARLRDRATKR